MTEKLILRIFLFMFVTIVSLVFYDAITPEKWHYLTADQIINLKLMVMGAFFGIWMAKRKSNDDY